MRYRDRTEYHAERRQYAHDETHDTLTNDESLYLDLVRVVESPFMSVQDKAGVLRARYSDLRDYNGAIIGRYANFREIVRCEMQNTPVLTREAFKAKYPNKGRINFPIKS